jgi:hypothetical protein
LDPGFSHLKNGGAALRLLGVHSPEVMKKHDDRLAVRFEDLMRENPDLTKILLILREHVRETSFNGYEQLMIEFDEA